MFGVQCIARAGGTWKGKGTIPIPQRNKEKWNKKLFREVKFEILLQDKLLAKTDLYP